VAPGGKCDICYSYNGILTFLFLGCFLTPLIFALGKLNDFGAPEEIIRIEGKVAVALVENFV